MKDKLAMSHIFVCDLSKYVASTSYWSLVVCVDVFSTMVEIFPTEMWLVVFIMVQPVKWIFAEPLVTWTGTQNKEFWACWFVMYKALSNKGVENN